MFVTRLGHRVASVPLFHRSFSTATVFVRPLYKNPNLLMQTSTQLTPIGVAKRQMRNLSSDHLSSDIEYLKMVELEKMKSKEEKFPPLTDLETTFFMEMMPIMKSKEVVAAIWDDLSAYVSPNDPKKMNYEEFKNNRLMRNRDKYPPVPGVRMTAWLQFYMEQASIVESKPGVRKITIISSMWKSLSYVDRIPYMIMAFTYRMRAILGFRSLTDAEQNELYEEAEEKKCQELWKRKEYWKKTGHPPRPLNAFVLYLITRFKSLRRIEESWDMIDHVIAVSKEWRKLNPLKKQAFKNIEEAGWRWYHEGTAKWKQKENEKKIKPKKEKKKSKNPRRSKKNSANSPVDTTGVDKICIENGCSKMDSPSEAGEKVKKPTNKNSKKTEKKSVDGPFLMLPER